MPPPKEHIIDRTMQMFVTQGIKSVRMDDIARQLGVSKRTLYELFVDKEELLFQTMEHYFELEYAQQVELSAGAGNVLEAIFMMLGDIMDRAEVSTRMMNNLHKFYPAVYEKVMRIGNEKNRTCMREMLEEGIGDGLFTSGFNIDLAITVLYHTCTALITRKDILLPEGMSEREAFVQIVSNFFRGISTSKGMQLVDDYLKHYEPDKKRR